MPRLLHVQNWEYYEIFSIQAFFSATLCSDCKCYTDPAKLQTHKMELKDKQEISSQHHGRMVLWCARIYLVTLSERECLILSSHKCSCHSDCPGTLSSAHLCSGLGTSSTPSGCLTQLFWGQRSPSWRNVSLGLECYCSSECMFWVIGYSLTALVQIPGDEGATLPSTPLCLRSEGGPAGVCGGRGVWGRASGL